MASGEPAEFEDELVAAIASRELRLLRVMCSGAAQRDTIDLNDLKRDPGAGFDAIVVAR